VTGPGTTAVTAHRLAKMASTVRAIAADAILNRLNDPRISPMTSVTRVEMSGDLQIAKLYISVLGSDADRRRTMRALEHAVGHIQRIVAKRLTTRHCPELRFEVDDSLKRAAETMRIIDRSIAESPGRLLDAEQADRDDAPSPDHRTDGDVV